MTSTVSSNATSAQSNEQILYKWYRALYEEDSGRLIQLLEKDSSLWKVGWESNPGLKVKGRPRNYWKKTTEGDWKGRTALHVGTRRGNVDLLKRVLELCRDSENARKTAPPDPRSRQDAPDRPSSRQDSPIIDRTATEEQKTEDASLSSRSHPQPVLDQHEPEEKVPRRDADVEEINLDSCFSLAMEDITRVSDDDRSLERLLLAKDEEYKLDPLAMAIVNGNRDVVSLILEASQQVVPVRDLYKIQFSESVSETQDENMRGQLRAITQGVIDKFQADPDFKMQVIQRYNHHRDFNFLPLQEYLFHFLFTDYDDDESDHLTAEGKRKRESSTVRKIYFIVRQEMIEKLQPVRELWDFLWALQDGQGRPPLHVAVDHMFTDGLATLFAAPAVDEQAITDAMNARDGAGRTVLHRSIVLGDDTLMNLLSDDDRSKSSLDRPRSIPDDDEPEMFRNWTSREIDWGACREALQKQIQEKEVPVRDWTSRTGTIWRMELLHLVSKANGFNGAKTSASTLHACESARAPLHSAIIHKHVRLVEMFVGKESGKESMQPSLMNRPIAQMRSSLMNQSIAHILTNWEPVTINCLELAALLGDVEVITALVKIQYKQDSRTEKRSPVPALHLLAAYDKYDLLQLFIDNGQDPLEGDFFGNTTLHYATKGMNVLEKDIDKMEILEMSVEMRDYAHCQQILDSKKLRKVLLENKTKDWSNPDLIKHQVEEALVEKQGCINLLIQEGCDIFKPNSRNELPYPSKDANSSFRSWWHQKHAKEFATAQRAQSAAANAISVTAALVATASYVGPLQPPLGYSENDPTELRVGITAVKVFVICDTMSFYLAIAAIISALVPCLPMPQQSMTNELRRTTQMVNAAVAMLFPSIICILMAFAAASIAVIQTNRTEWNRGGLTIGTASVGGFICLFFIGIFLIRWLAIICPKTNWIRTLYDKTSFENLGDIVLKLPKCARQGIGKLMKTES